jgi:capsular exopolysaccharide synthesis family protein
MVSESYRRFRANLRLSGFTRSLKTVLIAGGDTGEGKTSVAVNLAATFVAEGKKVLLIDANFRKPSLKKLFPRTQSGSVKAPQFDFGLSSVLTNQCGCKDAVRPTGIEDFDVIDSGPIPLNPVELLAGARMKELLSQCRKKYDHIIIDSAAVLLVSDAKGLAKLVNATILVFNAELTRRGSARRTINELRAVNAKVVGCVLFAAVPIKGGYFHERFRSYRRYLKPQLAAAQAF